MYRPRWICQMAAALGATRSIMDFDNSYEYIYVGAGYIRALYKRKAQLNGVPRVCHGCLPEPGHRSKQCGWWKSTTHTHRITCTNGGHKVRERERKRKKKHFPSSLLLRQLICLAFDVRRDERVPLLFCGWWDGWANTVCENRPV